MISLSTVGLDAGIQITVKTIHYTYPILVVFYFFTTLTIDFFTLPAKTRRLEDCVRKKFIVGWIFTVASVYLLQAILHVARGVVTKVNLDQDETFYLIASSITYGIQALVLVECQPPLWYPYFVTWGFAFIVELTLLGFYLNIYSDPKYDMVLLVEQVTRVLSFLLIHFYIFYHKVFREYLHQDAERQLVLSIKPGPKLISSKSFQYGYNTIPGDSNKCNITENDMSSDDSSNTEHDESNIKIGKNLKQTGNWFTYVKEFTIFLPYLWPLKDKTLQLRVILVILCLLVSSVLNVLVPRQMGTMIDSITKYAQGDHTCNILLPSIIYIVLHFINSSSGIGWLRQWLWTPIQQHSYHALSIASHSHIMDLSSDFHDSKKLSDIDYYVVRGQSVTSVLETICFQIAPICINLSLAIGYLTFQFGPYMGLMIMITVALYSYATPKLYTHRARIRRRYITKLGEQMSIFGESFDFWTTASLFNMIFHEKSRYAFAVEEQLQAKLTSEISSQKVDAAQGLIMATSLLSVLWLGFYQVVYGGKSIGQITILLVYWAQLSSPLVLFGDIYTSFMYSMMDAEKLLELLQTKPTIKDLPNSKPLELSGGLIRFDCVSFGYDPRKSILKNITFTALPGNIIALVGETGGGKSTILKLLDRFYDIDAGSITIDGQDIRNVTLSSLREKIGVVPQDPMLLNDTIMNNVRYAKLSATNEEVFEACRGAAFHEKILNFPDGYNSKVGNHGMKLSGGEKQRIAIARVILKRPELILLDEATSSVDTETEKKIQKSLHKICKGRTTFVVAHRLSTIMNADCIYVIMNGEIIEKGTHNDLVLKNGKYRELWSLQTCATTYVGHESNSQDLSHKESDANMDDEIISCDHLKNLKDSKKGDANL